jgi:uncharacterized pyridoxamine 5'-phosphate oxidase family protein
MTREEAIGLIQAAHIGYLGTVGTDNKPRVRPIGIHTVYDNDVYFFTFAGTRKVAELAGNPHVEVVWSNPKQLSQVRIRGESQLVTDEAVQQRFKNDEPIVAKLLPAGAEHLFRLYKIVPETVEAADGLVPYAPVSW